LASGGALSRGTLRRILEVSFPSLTDTPPVAKLPSLYWQLAEARTNRKLWRICEMSDRQKILSEFLENIYRIEKELNELDRFSEEISLLYNGNSFPEQEKLSSDLYDNFMICVTHETTSQIGFYRNDIENFAKFIEYRERYCEFSDNELSEILDERISMELKQHISKRFDNLKDMILRIDNLKQDWNTTFKNMKYAKIKKKLQI